MPLSLPSFCPRLVQGLVLGPCFPILNPLTNRSDMNFFTDSNHFHSARFTEKSQFRWSPESEKGTFVSFSYLGGTFGSVITFPLCGKHSTSYNTMILHQISYHIIFNSIIAMHCISYRHFHVDTN